MLTTVDKINYLRIEMYIKIDLNSLPRYITFCRHFESIGNAREKDDNSTDDTPNHNFGVSPNGYQQSEPVRNFIAKKFPRGFDEYYVTTFLRTHITFDGAIGNHIEPYEDPRLDEWWKGIFHSLTQDEISKFYPVENKVLEREGWYHYRPPQGESGKDVVMRILSFLNSLTPVESIFICGHGRWFTFFERILLQQSAKDTSIEVPRNGSIIQFSQNKNGYSKEVLFTP